MQRRNIILFIIILKSLLGFPISLYSQATISKIDSIYLISKNNSDDILKNEALSEYVKYYYRTKDWEQFHKYRKEQLKLALKIKDSASYAKVLEFSGAYFMNQNIPDSAYYFYNKSFQIYDFLCDSLSAGKALLNNAIIQKNVSDYVGSEATSFKALHYLLSTKNERRISSVYNNLGIVYNQLGDFGKVYVDKKDYDRAIEYYEQIFNSTSLLQINRIFYAVVLDNYTYAGFKNGKLTNIEDSFKEALSIREEAEETNGIIINCIHLAEYYKQKGNYPLALEYAKRAEKLSDSIRNYRDFLASLELMSSIYETNEAKTIFTKYIRIRDSLDRQTRNFKDQFARIRFETEEKENLIQNQQKNILNQEGEIKKRQTIIASFIVITLLVIILIIGIIIHRKRKQKQLEQELMKGFEPYLKGKYNLSNHNIEFWKLWITGIDQKSLSKKLFITVNSVKSRRKSLREKIEKVIPIEGKFDKPKAILLYNKELDFYKENRGNFSPDYQN